MTTSTTQHIEPANQLIVTVQDHTYNYCEKASVSIKMKHAKHWQKIPFNNERNSYIQYNLPAGCYDLIVAGKKGWISDEREIDIKDGSNTIYSSIAPANTPFYLAADNEKVFYQPVENTVLLWVFGNEGDRCISETCKKNKISFSKPNVLTAEEANTNGSHYFIDLPEKEKAREAFLDKLYTLVNKEIKTRGITAHITLPIVKGKTITEGLTNELIVKFKSHVSDKDVFKIAKRYGLRVVRTIHYLGNAYLLRYGKYPSYESFKRFLDLRAKLPIEWLEPNRIEPVTLDIFSPNDFLYPEQPHFPLINADDAWDSLDDINVNIRSGSPDITIAVFDVNGVSPSHPDLTGNLTDGTAKMVANFDFNNWQNQTVANLGGDHGTECASSATGRFNNASGATGLAGNCHLIGASLGPTLLDQADAWMWAAGFTTGNTNPSFPGPVSNPADVISNSWGANGAALSNTYRDAFDFLTTYGRGGRGCLVCFSLGNNGYIDFTTSPTRRRMYAAYEKTIAIGSSINSNPTNPVTSVHADQNGNTVNLPAVVDTRAYYSPYGPAVDIVAPSHTTYAAGGGAKVDSILSAVRVNQGDVIGSADTVTTLQTAEVIGANTITLNSSAGFAVGEFLLLGNPGAVNREYIAINNIAGNQVTLGTPLQNAYAAGTAVSTGPNDYSIDFGGTSHSCPTVAGAAALILSVRSNLNWVQVREVLRNTAVQIDATQANAIGQWVDSDGDTVVDFSQWYGYGRLDVNAAVTAIDDTTPLSDLVIRDNLEDVGAVPSAGWHAHSPDIWVRTSDDPIPTLAYGSAPPHVNAKRGQDNYVYLRVKNFGNLASNEVYLRALITHFPGFEFRYPNEWQPSNRPGQAVPNPLVPGTYLIGEQQIDNLAQNADTIVKITWDEALVPPETVMVGGVEVEWHPCILAEVSPHDGDDPSTTGHAVKDNNNLAHRNIRVDNADDSSSDDNFAVGVVAGTSDRYGVQSIILDRTALPSDYAIFIRPSDDRIMKKWLDAVRTNGIVSTDPLPGSKDEQEKPEASKDRCGNITLKDPTRLDITCCGGSHIIIHAAKETVIETQCAQNLPGHPKVSVGKFQNQDVIMIKGGSQAIELPINLASNQFEALAIGMIRPNGSRAQGYLKATQMKANGELSAGYTIEG